MRSAGTARVRMIIALALAMTTLASPATAQLRSPQVPVSGTALQSFLNTQGQAIDVATQQLDLQRASFAPSQSITLDVRVGLTIGLGLYNASLATPPLYLIWPGAATTGWFAVASFRTLPTRLVVNLFDANSNLVGTTTYLAGPPDPTNVGFYCQGPTDIAWSEDARNTGGQPRLLAFAATGAHAGKTWFACEATPGPGADYADAIHLLSGTFTPVDVARSTWGELKQRFR